MEKAQEITDKAFSQVLTRIRVGMTEKELCAELIYCLYKNGADGLSFDPIVVSGPNTSMPHGVPGDRALQEGDFITMDFGVLYEGYCSDMTRYRSPGYATEEMERVYNTVLEAQLAGIAASKAGVSGSEVDGAARKDIADAAMAIIFATARSQPWAWRPRGAKLQSRREGPHARRRSVLGRAWNLSARKVRRPD